MKILNFQLILLLLFAISMVIAMILSHDYLWMSLLFILLLFVIYISQKKSDWKLELLCACEVSCIASAEILFWLVIPLQIATIGLFTYSIDPHLDSWGIRSIIVLFGIIGVITAGVYTANHMLLPTVLVCIGALICIMYIFISEFRFQRQYAGDRV